ncbi:hypothetical protein [Rhodopirellula sp. P2]|uniref:hypothetical protein n=1 Tax=Rhodopirellula sp. P2 TaxID=2127060 RepID=UPI0023677546|nr:hypothetical protein [Rhodopirellula sp. P2]WDQ18076.1 hypothetical protein PSR62_05860 [Rhodopirellula sp. P2]
MNRFLSLLLIPFFVLGQASPHSHAGSGVVEPEGHANRPHVHLLASQSHDEDGHHHGHSHFGGDDDASEDGDGETNGVSLSSLPADHDSDAVYLGQSGTAVARSSMILDIDLACLVFASSEAVCWPLEGQSRVHHSFLDRGSPLPIYLLVRSLRI